MAKRRGDSVPADTRVTRSRTALINTALSDTQPAVTGPPLSLPRAATEKPTEMPETVAARFLATPELRVTLFDLLEHDKATLARLARCQKGLTYDVAQVLYRKVDYSYMRLKMSRASARRKIYCDAVRTLYLDPLWASPKMIEQMLDAEYKDKHIYEGHPTSLAFERSAIRQRNLELVQERSAHHFTRYSIPVAVDVAKAKCPGVRNLDMLYSNNEHGPMRRIAIWSVDIARREVITHLDVLVAPRGLEIQQCRANRTWAQLQLLAGIKEVIPAGYRQAPVYRLWVDLRLSYPPESDVSGADTDLKDDPAAHAVPNSTRTLATEIATLSGPIRSIYIEVGRPECEASQVGFMEYLKDSLRRETHLDEVTMVGDEYRFPGLGMVKALDGLRIDRLAIQVTSPIGALARQMDSSRPGRLTEAVLALRPSVGSLDHVLDVHRISSARRPLCRDPRMISTWQKATPPLPQLVTQYMRSGTLYYRITMPKPSLSDMYCFALMADGSIATQLWEQPASHVGMQQEPTSTKPWWWPTQMQRGEVLLAFERLRSRTSDRSDDSYERLDGLDIRNVEDLDCLSLKSGDLLSPLAAINHKLKSAFEIDTSTGIYTQRLFSDFVHQFATATASGAPTADIHLSAKVKLEKKKAASPESIKRAVKASPHFQELVEYYRRRLRH